MARGALVVGTRNTDHYQCTWHCQCGGHDDDMNTDRRDVMPGRMGGEEKVKARGEDGRANHKTAPTIKHG